MPSLSIYSFILLNEHTVVIHCASSPPSCLSSWELPLTSSGLFSAAFTTDICLWMESSLWSWTLEVQCFIASQPMNPDVFIFLSSGRDSICCVARLFPPHTPWASLYESTQLWWGITSSHPLMSDFLKSCLCLLPRCPVTQQGSSCTFCSSLHASIHSPWLAALAREPSLSRNSFAF